VGCCISHRGEEGSVCVLDVSAVRAKRGSHEDSDVRHDASVLVLTMMGSSLAGNPLWKYEGRKCGRWIEKQEGGTRTHS